MDKKLSVLVGLKMVPAIVRPNVFSSCLVSRQETKGRRRSFARRRLANMRISDIIAKYEDAEDDSREGVARDVLFLALSLNLFKRDDVLRLVSDRRHVAATINSVEPEKVQDAFFLVLSIPEVQQAIAKGVPEDDVDPDGDERSSAPPPSSHDGDDCDDGDIDGDIDDDDDDFDDDDDDFDDDDDVDGDEGDSDDDGERMMHDASTKVRIVDRSAVISRRILQRLSDIQDTSMLLSACHSIIVVGCLIITMAALNSPTVTAPGACGIGYL